MTEKLIKFRCYRKECRQEPPTEVFVEIPHTATASGGTKRIVKYCSRNHENVLEVPEDWDVRPPVFDLGEDVLSPRGAPPVLEGRDPYA